MITSTRTALTAAEKQSGGSRKTALTQLASKLDKTVSVHDDAKLRLLKSAVSDLAK